MTEPRTKEAEGVLTGIRVLELANYVAAPSCGAMMADMGADVIKVEPPGGEPYRRFMQRAQEFDYPFKSNMAFQLDNRGKRSIEVDLTHPGGPGFVLDAVRRIDVFLTNLLPKRRERFGLTPEAILKANPRIIDVSLTGYGTQGPDADKPGFDHSAFWARSGIMALMGEPPSTPALQRGAMGDHTAAMNLLAAILAALRLRDLTGEGQRVEVSLLATGMWVLGADIVSVLADPQQPPRHNRHEPANPMWNSYLTRDDLWILLVMPQSDPYWPSFCQAVDKPDWEADPNYATHELRMPHTAQLTAELEKIFARHTLAEWAEILDRHGLIWSPVTRITDVIQDPQAEANNRYPELDHPEIGRFRTVAIPFLLDDESPGTDRAAPDHGQHADEVLRDLQFGRDEIAELQAKGVIGRGTRDQRPNGGS